jgi:hypothetical protein
MFLAPFDCSVTLGDTVCKAMMVILRSDRKGVRNDRTKWALDKIAADGAIFSAAVLGKRPNGPEKFMNYCGFISREGDAARNTDPIDRSRSLSWISF